MVQPEILTIREVEAALHMSGPRIHQLLASGELDGPGLPPGRKRHSPGAPRVTRMSVNQYLRDRAEEKDTSPPRPLRMTTSASQETGRSAGESSAKAVAQEMKVRLDAMRDELVAERARNKDLLEVVDKLVGLLRSSQTSADRLNDVTDGYSEALTQLLTPDSAE
jgi:hypothetical protein